jgi:hypothetical protein
MLLQCCVRSHDGILNKRQDRILFQAIIHALIQECVLPAVDSIDGENKVKSMVASQPRGGQSPSAFPQISTEKNKLFNLV